MNKCAGYHFNSGLTKLREQVWVASLLTSKIKNKNDNKIEN